MGLFKNNKTLGEFKAFLMRGNVLDLAVGVIIGGAFQKIVTSVVNDLIMPLVGVITGGINFNDQFYILRVPDGVDAAAVAAVKTIEEAKALGISTLNYGAFITIVLDFLIMASVIFLLIKGINKLSALGKKEEEPTPAPAPTTKVCPYCQSEIALAATRCPHCTSQLDAHG